MSPHAPPAPTQVPSLEEISAEEVRARLAAIVEDSHDAIVSKTLHGIITSWNRAAERLFGYPAVEAVGRSITLIVPRERIPEEADILARLRRGERIESYETQRLRKDGGIVDVSLTISPIRDRRGQIIGASKIARDIGTRKLEERRKDEFLAIMAHELRNPLAPLVNSLEILDTGVDPAAQRELLGVVQRQARTLVRLVDDLMDASRIGRGMIELKREPVSLVEPVDAAIEISRPLVDDRHQQLRVDAPDEPLLVSVDSTRLTQVVANLLNNAAKYTPEHGHIAIRLRREGDTAAIRVADDGQGIPGDMLARVFDMFTQIDTRASRTQGGLGIGLSLVKRLVEAHGGTVEAHSAGVGRGSEFVVRLPLLPDAPVARWRQDAHRTHGATIVT